ncbi:tyrosine-type recombinase/integrase [Singulisphaera acidiphila]|uniref:Site-specific recombinase XerD n=1 Tax=Singulisphaera acidiphila (strain ATCC BAA-1392 / DSM 18658 / VKM B-2454 / MOB10) TaxID=886293 RepID=L0DAZ7_SINAD|nr:site-specific integrase [Singulisphaera acidiphila]AGA26013.1 site-specific recombinase XerD [Singulisphaera acidiphila DSM 18658]
MSFRTPSYRLHKPTGQAVVTIDDRDFYLGKHGTEASRNEYDRLIAEWLAAGRKLPVANDATVSELMVGFLKWADAYYVKDGEPTSEAALFRLSLAVLRKAYGHTQAKDFGPLALKTVRQAFIDAKLCRNEVNRRTRHIIRFFKWAVENELVPPSVHHGLKAVAGLRKGRTDVRESKPVKPVPDAFVDAVKPHVSRQVWAMIELQRLTGMRPGEVTIMRTMDLDTTGKVWEFIPHRHKTEHHDRDRLIFIGPRAQDVLRLWLKTDLGAYLFSPKEAEADRLAEMRRTRKTPVQPSQRNRSKTGQPKQFGDHYEVRAYYTAVNRGCDKANVPMWGPNRLRHNAATRLRREFGLDVARVILGHSSPAVTEVYAEVDREKALGVMGQIG